MSGPTLDAYALTPQRDRGTIERFLHRYVDLELADDRGDEELMLLPLGHEGAPDALESWEWEPARSLSHIIERGLEYPRRAFSVSLAPRTGMADGVTLAFTAEDRLVLGLHVNESSNSPEFGERVRILLGQLLSDFGCTAGVLTAEEAPPLREAAFEELGARWRHIFRPMEVHDLLRPSETERTRQAVALARAGRTREGVLLLTELAANGDAPAAGALAEIRAFQGDWEATFDCLGRQIELGVTVGDLRITDALDLLVRAAEELGRRDQASALLDAVLTSDASQCTRDVRAARYARRLRARIRAGRGLWVRRVGEEIGDWMASAGLVTVLDPTDEDRIGWIARGLLGSLRPATELQQSLLASLGSFRVAIVDAHALAARGDLSTAWACVEPTLSSWYPILWHQVAPTRLLTGPMLRRMMTAERCQHVLATPRGRDDDATD